MYSILLSGFGGQGILFAGKQLANAGMVADKHVTWLPSYGPEMRGGTANCSVIIADEPIGSPLVTNPDLLIAMNLPSFTKFEPKIVKGGTLLADSSLISVKSTRTDIECRYIPATSLADENGLKGMANVIMLGYFLSFNPLFEFDRFLEVMCAKIPASKAALLEANKKALKLGYDYRESK